MVTYSVSFSGIKGQKSRYLMGVLKELFNFLKFPITTIG